MAALIEILHPFRKTVLVASSLLVCFLIVSCGESNNLDDPQEIVSTSSCKDLESEGVVCVSGYFVDDAVARLNYSCGKVNAITNDAGGFSCPQDSDVEFSILNPDDSSKTAKKIVLGDLRVKSLPKSASQDTALYFTPADFGAEYQSNIVRLLQTLRKDDGVDDAQLPSRKIVIEDETKKKLVHLSESIKPTDFSLSAADFDSLVDPLMVSLTRTMIDVEDAETFLNKSLHSTVAGSYWVPGGFTTFGYASADESKGDYLGSIRGISASNYLLASSWNVVDRKGRITGFGIYSTGSTSVTAECKLLLYVESCDDQPARSLMRLRPDAGVTWANWNADGSWRLSYTLADDSGTALPGSIFSFVQGTMDRGAIVGTSYLYSTIFGINVAANSSLLGQWTLSGSPSFNNPSETSATIARRRAVAPTLDPRFWDKDKLDFPLDIDLTFYESDGTTQIGTLSFLILSDGNVVSNLYGQCGEDIDLYTLKYPNGETEFSLGTVAQAFRAINNGVTRVYLAPMIIVPDNAAFDARLRNMDIGLADDGVRGVRLRVDTENGGSAYLKIYKDNAFSEDNASDDQAKSALWSDQHAFLKYGGAGAMSIAGVLSSQKGSCPPHTP